MTPLPSLRTITANVMIVLVIAGARLNDLREFVQRTAGARAALTIGQRPGRLVGYEANVILRAPLGVACDLLHSHVAEEGDEVAHSPGAAPVHPVGGELLSRVGRRVENS